MFTSIAEIVSKTVELMVVKVALGSLKVAWRSLAAFVVNDVAFSQQTAPPVVFTTLIANVKLAKTTPIHCSTISVSFRHGSFHRTANTNGMQLSLSL